MIDLNVLCGMKGKTALITGASSGLGAGIARFFASAGVRVMGLARSERAGQAVIDEIVAQGGDACFRKCDVTVMADCEAAAKAAFERWGRIDCLVNCAGATRRQTVEDLEEADWDRVIDATLKGVYTLCHCVVPYMKRQGGGKIVNIGSGWSLKGGDQAVAYCASKGGVWNMTRALAIDCGPHNINVNCVCPGDCDTPMLKSECEQLGGTYDDAFKASCAVRPLARLGTPEDVAMSVFFLCSDMASWITGSSLVVDGGGIA